MRSVSNPTDSAENRRARCTAAAGAPWGIVVGCLRHDELLARWRDHRDDQALALLLAAVPTDLPAAVLRLDRDLRLRRLAGWLQQRLPGAPRNRVAVILAEAGTQMQAGRRQLHGLLFDALAPDERHLLAQEVAAILDTARWPGHRQIVSIIAPDF